MIKTQALVFVAFSITTAHAGPQDHTVIKSACAIASQPDDPVARRVALLNAVTAPIRNQFTPHELPQRSIAGQRLQSQMHTVIARRMQTAEIQNEIYEPGHEKPGQICITVKYAE